MPRTAAMRNAQLTRTSNAAIVPAERRSTMYVLEDCIPFVKQGRPCKYPFDRMKKGQSFLVPVKQARSVKVLVSYHNRMGRGRFAYRNTDEGLRVWRLA